MLYTFMLGIFTNLKLHMGCLLASEYFLSEPRAPLGPFTHYLVTIITPSYTVGIGLPGELCGRVLVCHGIVQI